MTAPPVRYVTTRDGYSIAYAVSGAGRPLLFMPQPISHIRVYWSEPTWVLPWLQGLATRFQLVQYDGRGQGMSTRGLRPTFSMADVATDLEAVIDCLQLERFVLMAAHGFGHAAVRYAAAHPERVEALILVSCALSFAGWSLSMLLPLGERDWDALLRSQAALSQAQDLSASIQRQKQSITQEDHVILTRAMASSDIASLLPGVQTPSLILHAKESLNMPPEESMKLAAAIPGSRMVLLDGATPLGDHMQGLQAIDDFLASLPDRSHGAGAAGLASSWDGLSSREVEVLSLIAAGRSNQQIADELVISINTVGRHVSNIFAKANVANRTEAAAYALQRGLLAGPKRD